MWEPLTSDLSISIWTPDLSLNKGQGHTKTKMAVYIQLAPYDASHKHHHEGNESFSGTYLESGKVHKYAHKWV